MEGLPSFHHKRQSMLLTYAAHSFLIPGDNGLWAFQHLKDWQVRPAMKGEMDVSYSNILSLNVIASVLSMKKDFFDWLQTGK
jgi:hypothetical protein